MIVAAAAPARAIDAVSVRSYAPAIDLTAVLDHQRSDGDRIQVSTAPGTDGIVRRIEVRAREGGQNWVVFALANNTDDQLDRLIVAPHYRIVSSGLLWPDLGLSRIATITPSTGDRPERQESPTADVFRITLDPGAVITFVAELRTDKLPQLWPGRCWSISASISASGARCSTCRTTPSASGARRAKRSWRQRSWCSC